MREAVSGRDTRVSGLAADTSGAKGDERARHEPRIAVAQFNLVIARVEGYAQQSNIGFDDRRFVSVLKGAPAAAERCLHNQQTILLEVDFPL